MEPPHTYRQRGLQVFRWPQTEAKCGRRFVRSHIDGSSLFFTPERVMDIQRVIGADIVMAFDGVPPGDAEYSYACKSLDLTEQWLKRCGNQFATTEPHYGYSQSLFPIVQGCVYPDLRRRAAEYAVSFNCDGMQLAAFRWAKPAEEMYRMIEVGELHTPKNSPRYLMGVGTPENILEAIAWELTLFDCVLPPGMA